MTQHHGSAADLSALKGMKPFDEFIITSGITGVGNVYEYRGGIAGWVLISRADGAGFVANVGINGTPQTQTVTNTGTRTRFTFDPAISACNISILAGADVAALDEGLVYCFSAPTTGVADDWLTETNTAPRFKIKQADGVRSHYFNGATVTYVDVKAVGTGVDMDVTVEGIV